MKLLIIIILSILFQQALTETCDCSSSQRTQYGVKQANDTYVAKTVFGRPIPSLTNSLTVGNRGPVLLQDTYLIEAHQLFNRERIPQRVVHAKGTGAFGYFEVTNPKIKDYTKADFLQPGRRTKVLVRFSLSITEGGGPDTRQDTKGMAAKFYTKDGIHDITTLQVPVFFSDDAMLFPHLIRAFKRNPYTNLDDPTSGIDFTSHLPQMSLFFLMALLDTGRPKSYRCLRGSAINTYKMVNSYGTPVYVKFHFIPSQKEEFYTFQEMIQMFAVNKDAYIQDLREHIEKKEYPKWTLYIQVMTYEQAKNHYENPFDVTKLWKDDEFPWIPVGVMTLNENPQNHFNQVEQAAFSPSNMVRGIEASPDRLLQARMFAYPDAQLYRLGANHAQLPVNRCPFEVHTYNQRDGSMNVGTNGEGAPHYYPNSFNGFRANTDPSYNESVYHLKGDVKREDVGGDQFSTAKWFYETQMKIEERQRVIENLVATLSVTAKSVQKRFINDILCNISPDLAARVKGGLQLISPN